MIKGIGIDLVEIKRIEAIIKKNETPFINRIFSTEEQTYIPQPIKRRIEFIAGRFAGKEAVAKALGTGIGKEIGWKDIEIIPLDSGQPTVKLKENAGLNILISITHTTSLAMAKVIIEEK